jgi:hypothetical protein
MSNHLKESNETYLSHCWWAIKSGIVMIVAGVISIIHGIFPNLFEFYTAKTVVDLYHKRLYNHKNKKYQDYIKSVKEKVNIE